MTEMRRDSITGDLIIYSSVRNNRPRDKEKKEKNNKNINKSSKNEEFVSNCPFCRGNEHLNDDSMDEICCSDGWLAKSISNKYPILDLNFDTIFGKHEVVVETHRHNGEYYNMSIEEFNNVFKLYKDRFKSLSSVNGISYINIFKNSKSNSGASLVHPHSQIISMSVVPPEVQKELDVASDFYKKNNVNLYDHIINSEINYKKRVIFDGECFLVYVPFATRYSGEVRIISKNNINIDELSEAQLDELSYIYYNFFRNWESFQGEIPFNVIIHTDVIGKKNSDIFRTHIHIVPRKYNFGGFELSTNFFVCGTDPEELASILKF